MQPNIGTSDRIFRIIIAITLLGYAIWAHSWIAFGASLFTFFESFMSWCVFYALIGRNTCPLKKKK